MEDTKRKTASGLKRGPLDMVLDSLFFMRRYGNDENRYRATLAIERWKRSALKSDKKTSG